MADTQVKYSPAKTLSDLNRHFFDAHGSHVFDQDWVKKLAAQLTDALQSQVDDIAIRKPARDDVPVKMLDYACGNGVASKALAPHVEIVRGIDISDAMVESYNHMARAAGQSEVMHAVQGDFLANEEIVPAEEYSNFDVAVISMALHHVASPQELLSKLVARLQHDGVIVVLDWTPGATDQEPVKHHDVHATISKGSFSKTDMTEMFTTAGCKPGIAYHEYKETTFIPGHLSGVDGGVEKRFFVAWARRE